MNNKGQSLVTFVLILPILLLIVLMVYEIGMMSRLKNEMNSINYLAISYGIDKITDENLEEEIKALILKNDDKIENIVVSVEDIIIGILGIVCLRMSSCPLAFPQVCIYSSFL